MRPKYHFLACAALALTIMSLTTANGQTGTAPNPRQTKVEARIRDMYATLHITKQQEPAWDAFAQVMLDNAQAMDTAVKQYGTERAKLNAVQILDNYAAISEQHARNVERLSAAMEVLYASLTPEQQQTADAMFRMSMRRKMEPKKP